MPKTYSFRHSPWRPGFTLIELLVAITLSLIMIAIIDRLFLDTTRAVGVGIGLNDIMNNGQTFYDQIQRDAANMLGPDPSPQNAGFLIIINKKYTYDPTTQSPQIENARTGPQPADIRSDQLVFITKSNYATDESKKAEYKSITSGSSTTFWSQIPSGNAKVWYGHALKTQSDGIPRTKERLAQEPHHYANRWTLGRQALILAGPTVANHGAAPNGVYPDGSYQFFLDGAKYDSDIQELASYPAELVPGLRKAFSGITDVCNKELGSTPTSSDDIRSWLLSGDYKERALDYTYAFDTGGANFLDYRLRFNPRSVYSQTDSSYQYQAWQINQTHPGFLGNASDFVVEFAGDLNNDGVIDHDSGQIKWYDGYPPNSGADSPIHPFPKDSDMVAPSTIRIHQADASTYSSFDSKYQPLATAPSLANYAFVWRHDNTQAFGAGVATDNCSWPYMIRIRIRLHDTKGEVIGSTVSNTIANPTDPVTKANAGKTIPGRWFEQIIKVPRP